MKKLVIVACAVALALVTAGWDSLGQRELNKEKQVIDQYLATDETGIFTSWTVVGAPTVHEAVDDDPLLPPNLTDYFGGIATDTGSVLLFGFPFGDPAVGHQFNISHLRVRLVVGLAGAGPADLSVRFFGAQDPGVSEHVVSISAVAPAYEIINVTSAQKLDGTPWTAADLRNAGGDPGVLSVVFGGVWTNPAVDIRIYAVALYVHKALKPLRRRGSIREVW